MNESKIAEERIKKLLLSDKIGAYSGFIEMLKTDIYNTLKEYMEIKKIELRENRSPYKTFVFLDVYIICKP